MLHYDDNRDQAFCFSCVMAYKNKYLQSTSCLEKSFVSHTGFNCWKDAIVKFVKHECSQSHKDAVLKTVTLPSTTKDVGEMLTTTLASERSQRRKCFLKLLSNARFLTRQGLTFRADGEDSNFIRLLYLRAEDNAKLLDWMKQKTKMYTSGYTCKMKS